nr:ComEC/Rec2 family competence protein [Hufsiella ginkgonis]
MSRHEIPFVRLLLPLTAGVVAAITAGGDLYLKALLGSLVLFSFLFVLLCVVAYQEWGLHRFRWLPGLTIYGCLFFAGYFLTLERCERMERSHFSNKTADAFVVRISSEPVRTAAVTRFECEVIFALRSHRLHKTTGRIQLMVKNDSAFFLYGDLFLVPSVYQEVATALNPAEFDYSKFLANRAIYHQAFLNRADMRLLRRDTGSPLIARAFAIRQKMVAKYAAYIHDADAAALASTLILGYRAGLDREIVNAYSKTGTTHVLSVSGMHVGIVFLVLVMLLKFMDRSITLRIIRAALVIVLIAGYAILTGLSPAVCRAALMLSFVVIAKAVNRDMNSYNLVTTSAFLLLLYNPYLLVDAGFQLSYLAVLGLIAIYPAVYEKIFFKNRIADKLWSCTAVSIAAQLATFPLSVYYFHQFPVYFLISNIFILLPVTILMYAGLLFLFLPGPSVLEPFGWILEKIISFMNHGLMYLEKLPWATADGLWISSRECLIWYLLLIATGAYYIKRQLLPKYLALVCISLLVLINSVRHFTAIKQQRVIVYSLRGAQAISFVQGRFAYVLTDLLQTDNLYNFSVKPSLSAAHVAWIERIPFNKVKSDRFLFTDGVFLKFRDFKMLICDSMFITRRYRDPVSVDLVMIRGSPAVSLQELSSGVKATEFIIDGSNRPYLIRQWQEEAKLLNIRTYLLKKHQARQIDLKSLTLRKLNKG